MAELEMGTLESWLWEAACKIRGPLDAPKFKDYILPLIFLKRLSDVFEDQVAGLVEEFGDEDTALLRWMRTTPWWTSTSPRARGGRASETTPSRG